MSIVFLQVINVWLNKYQLRAISNVLRTIIIFRGVDCEKEQNSGATMNGQWMGLWMRPMDGNIEDERFMDGFMNEDRSLCLGNHQLQVLGMIDEAFVATARVLWMVLSECGEAGELCGQLLQHGPSITQSSIFHPQISSILPSFMVHLSLPSINPHNSSFNPSSLLNLIRVTT